MKLNSELEKDIQKSKQLKKTQQIVKDKPKPNNKYNIDDTASNDEVTVQNSNETTTQTTQEVVVMPNDEIVAQTTKTNQTNDDSIYNESTSYQTTNIQEEIEPIAKDTKQQSKQPNKTIIKNSFKPTVYQQTLPNGFDLDEDSEDEEIDLDMDNYFSKYIQTTKINRRIYKKYTKSNMRLCNDFGRTTLLIGPFKSDSDRNRVLSKISKVSEQTAYSIDYTSEALKKLCK